MLKKKKINNDFFRSIKYRSLKKKQNEQKKNTTSINLSQCVIRLTVVMEIYSDYVNSRMRSLFPVTNYANDPIIFISFKQIFMDMGKITL